MEYGVTGTYGVLIAIALLLAFVLAAGIAYYVRSNESYDPNDLLDDED